MTRSCEKQGCNEPADVAFGIDRVACVVWLENYDEDEQRHLNRLCDDHAARLTLPRGWSFDDRREHSPRLFVATRPNERPLATKPAVATKTTPTSASPASGKPAAKSPRKGSNKTGAVPRRMSRDASSPMKRTDGPGLFDPTLPLNSPRLAPLPTDTEPESPDPSAGNTKPVYAPKFDRTSDVGGTLNATGRLLRRAFSSQTKPIERPSGASESAVLPQGDHVDDFHQGDHVE